MNYLSIDLEDWYQGLTSSSRDYRNWNCYEKRIPIGTNWLLEVLKESGEIKDLSLGLVEHVLSTSPEFVKLPNGFYDLSKG